MAPIKDKAEGGRISTNNTTIIRVHGTKKKNTIRGLMEWSSGRVPA
jgi:hypothetical protein